MSARWKLPVFNADANKVSKEIENIGEEVNAPDLVEYAQRNPDSEMHKCFEWDDTIAAEKYRLQQAEKIIRCLVTVPDEPQEPEHREYVYVKTEKGETAYKKTVLVYQNDTEREDLLSRAIRELRAFEEKYKILTELCTVFDAINEL